ncbi:MAG: pilus assembly protein PilP [Aestuariibacter sp.]
MRTWLGALMILALSACSSDTSDLQAYMLSVQQTTNFPIEPYPEFKKAPIFKYSASEVRDPFQRLQGEEYEVADVPEAQCNQPDLKREKMPLERYGIDALRLRGFFTSLGKTYALIVANDNSVHQATVGDRLGLFFGEIKEIEGGTVHFVEQLPDGTGCWQEKQATLTMADTTGTDSNV